MRLAWVYTGGPTTRAQDPPSGPYQVAPGASQVTESQPQLGELALAKHSSGACEMPEPLFPGPQAGGSEVATLRAQGQGPGQPPGELLPPPCREDRPILGRSFFPDGPCLPWAVLRPNGNDDPTLL